MDDLGSGNVPGWRGRILGQGPFRDDDLSLSPGEALVFPAAIPLGSGTARSGRIPGPWGPIATFLECSPTNLDEDASVTLALEWPFTPLGINPPLSKVMAEQLHLQLFTQDWWEGRGSPPFIMVEQADRPDFRVRNFYGDFGLDVTRLTSPLRRRAQDLFRHIRARVRADPQSFSRLRGQVVVLWFPDTEGGPGSGLPPARPDHATRDLMVRHLQRLDPLSVQSHVQECAGLPGAGTSVAPMTGLKPGTGFFDACGFELVFAYSTQHTAEDVWGEISRVAVQHDYEGCDKLVISVGTPAAPHGESTPADHLLWGVAEPQGGWFNPPPLEHIRTIDVHDWWLGSITRLYPRWEVLAPARRSGPTFPVRPPGRYTGPPIGWSVTALRG